MPPVDAIHMENGQAHKSSQVTPECLNIYSVYGPLVMTKKNKELSKKNY